MLISLGVGLSFMLLLGLGTMLSKFSSVTVFTTYGQETLRPKQHRGQEEINEWKC